MTITREQLELARLKELLSYCSDTGIFTWIKCNSNVASIGKIASSSVNSDGYSQIGIDNRQYKTHRLAWFYCHGEWPDQIDHINGNRNDNRIANLRNVSYLINCQNHRTAQKNNLSGFLGVSTKKDGTFQADIRAGGKKRYIGRFKTPEEAHEAYLKVKRELHSGCTI